MAPTLTRIDGMNTHMDQLNISAVNPRILDTRSSPSKWKMLAPIVAVECYLSLTVFVFAFGPWPWPVQNPVTLYSYLFLAQAALLFGYLTRANAQNSYTVYTGGFSSSRLLTISVWLNILWIVPYFYLKLGSDGFSVTGIISHVVAGAMDPSKAYADKLNGFSSGSNALLYVYMLFSPILWLAVPLGASAWRSLSLRMKALIVAIVLTRSATWIALGTTKGVADIAGAIVISILATRKSQIGKQNPLMSSSNLRRIAVAILVISALVFSFSYTQNSRSKGQVSVTDRFAGITLDTNNIFIAGLPPMLQSAMGKGTTYLSQGYYGLSLALDEPFEWSYGVGHSMFLSAAVKKLTDFDAAELTYMARVQHTGWDMSIKWDSIYPWLASDVTFPGTLLVLFLIGRLLASVWIDVQSGVNPYALPLFVMLMLGIFYFPANDQLLSAAESFLAFWMLLFFWMSTRRTIQREW